MIIAGLVSLAFAGNVAIPVAASPPRFDIEQTCRNAGEPYTGVGRPNQACRDDESKAASDLRQNWTKFNIRQRDVCVEGARLGGPPSYVQVLTCLEMAAHR